MKNFTKKVKNIACHNFDLTISFLKIMKEKIRKNFLLSHIIFLAGPLDPTFPKHSSSFLHDEILYERYTEVTFMP